nr:hypothetical protein [Pseudonocardia oceani]
MTVSVRVMNPRVVTSWQASGSIALGSKPEATMTSSGANASSAGPITVRAAYWYAPSPQPTGIGMLTL